MPGHEGIDIKAAADSKISAVLAGKVTYVQHDPTKSNYGKHLWIDHQDGRNTHYAHLNRIDVSVGQMVTAGQQLGLAGSTGNSSGPHLHFDLNRPGKTYIDAKGQVWPWNRHNPWWELEHLYKPDGRTVLEGWVYDPYLTKGSDGQAVNYSTNLSLRSGPGSNHPKIGTVPYGTLHELLGDVENGYRPVLTWAVAESPPTPVGIDLTRFMLADPTCWRVVKGPNGQEDVQDLQLGGGVFVRRKNQLGEWWKIDSQYAYLIHDTSPAPADTGPEAGIERVYTITKNGQPGAPKNTIVMAVGQSWTETGSHQVQFKAKADCRLLATNSGNATNTAVFTRHELNYTFNGYGQNLTFEEVIWLQTGQETQIYGRKDGKPCGWIGGSAPWWSAEPVEIHWDRPVMVTEPNRYCSW